MQQQEFKIKHSFFPHDYSPLEDRNLLKLFIEMGAEGYGLFWLIVEYMHQNVFVVGEEYLLAYKFRTDEAKIKKIMNDYELFIRSDGEDGVEIYISNRILRNLNYVEQKATAKQLAANTRWLLAAFNAAYEEFFDEIPVLTSEEIEELKKYSKKIPDLKEKIRDIIYTLKKLKFSENVNFKPCANWLLKGNNLARLYNGEFGKLQHKKTKSELAAEEKELAKELAERNKPSEFEIELSNITDKSAAIEFILKNSPKPKTGKWYISPPLKELAKKFDITENELRGQNA